MEKMSREKHKLHTKACDKIRSKTHTHTHNLELPNVATYIKWKASTKAALKKKTMQLAKYAQD